MATVTIEPDLVLEFEIDEHRSPNLENVARALLAWNGAVHAAVTAIDPAAAVTIELVGIEPGSQRYKQVFRRVEAIAKAIDDGGEEYPYIWKHTKWLAACIAGGIIGGGIMIEMTPTPHAPPEEIALLKDIRDTLKEDLELRRSSQSFFEVMQQEPSFTGMEIFEGNSPQPTYTVPRADFAHKSGLFDVQEDIPEAVTEKARQATWEVVLVKPVLVGKQRRWTFARDGIEFSALMTDKAVLRALHDKTLAIPFAEGVMMQIEVSWKERSDGKAWLPVSDSRKVTKVLNPLVPAPPVPLLADAN